MIAIENQLVQRARDGDFSAATELVDKSYEAIYAFLRRLCGNEADAADLTQKTYSRLWSALPRFEGRSSASTWLHGIAYHVFLDWQRSNHRTESRPDEWWMERPDSRAAPDRQTIDQDLRATLWAAVQDLAPDLRQTVHLHYFQGLSLDETAEIMEIASSTVKYRLRNALQILRDRVADRYTTTSNSPSSSSL